MGKVLLTAAAAAIAASAMMTGPASAGPFCATYADGGIRSCNFYSYAACARTVRGAGGSCAANTRYDGGYGYADAYAYAPGPVYGPHYGYDDGYYVRPGIGVVIGGY